MSSGPPNRRANLIRGPNFHNFASLHFLTSISPKVIASSSSTDPLSLVAQFTWSITSPASVPRRNLLGEHLLCRLKSETLIKHKGHGGNGKSPCQWRKLCQRQSKIDTSPFWSGQQQLNFDIPHQSNFDPQPGKIIPPAFESPALDRRDSSRQDIGQEDQPSLAHR